MKLWKGRFKKDADPRTNDFNSSISFDSRMVDEDIQGSIAHAEMLGMQGIISEEESKKICQELEKIRGEISEGALLIDPDAEDIHTFIESELTKRIGDSGKRLHTARSRNDQVALDIRLTLRKEINEIVSGLKELTITLSDKAAENYDVLMPGYTHLQRAQPVTFGHHLLAYCEMILRDSDRFIKTRERMNYCPLGSGALAGTTYPINRQMTSDLLGFSGPTQNSIDGVSDRDFCAETAFDSALTMVHLSRLCEEIVMWSSWEFKFIELDDAYTTGSSIMPQKKNPDIAELIRGKSGRTFGDLVGILTMMKGIPLAYNKDLQEDKEQVFDSVDTLKACIIPLIPMISTMTVMKDNMRRAAAGGYINATDCADYLVSEKGLPFRDAYKITGEIVSLCIDKKTTLEELPLSEYKKMYEGFDEGIYKAISLEKCLNDRKVLGGPAPENVKKQAARVRELAEKLV
jgi:argininosuccinate lyase